MKDEQFQPLTVMDEDEGWKLLERKSINNRTLIAWYNPIDSIISIALFHLTENLRNSSTYTNWGYPVYFVTDMNTPKEAAEVVSLYLQDMEASNFWWE